MELEYRDLGWRTRFLSVNLALNAGFIFLLPVMRTWGPTDARISSFGSDLAVSELVWILAVPTVASLYSISMFVTAVAVCHWMGRACSNAHALATGPMATPPSVSPRWAWAYFFVPFVGLYRPMLSMQEIDTASTGEFARDPLIGTWWGAWTVARLATGFLGGGDSALQFLPLAGYLIGHLALIQVAQRIHATQVERSRYIVATDVF